MSMVGSLFGEIAQALRRIVRHPWHPLLLIAILALGVGANTALFTTISQALLEPLSYPEPERLVRISQGEAVNKLMARVTAEVDAFESVSPFVSQRFALFDEGGAPVVLDGGLVGHAHFDVLGVPPAMGRGFAESDSAPGAPQVVVLHDRLWVEYFGADAGIIGSTVRIDGEPRTVIGVMPAGFEPLDARWRLWVPLTVDPANTDDLLSSFYLQLMARLVPGRSLAAAEQALSRRWLTLQEEHPLRITDEKVANARLLPLGESLVGETRQTLVLVWAAAGLMLLIVCLNIGSLIFARNLQRRRELSLRIALGARLGQMAALFFGELLIVAMAGAALALAVASVALGLLQHLLPAALGTIDAGELFSLPTLAVNGGLACVAVAVAGFFPLWKMGRQGDHLVDHLKDELSGVGGGRESRRASALLVILQVGAATFLLFTAGSILTSLWQLTAQRPADDAAALTFRLDLHPSVYPEAPQKVELVRRALERLRAIPSVSEAGAIHLLPLTEGNWNFPYMAEGYEIPTTGAMVSLPTANFRAVTPGYFAAGGIEILQGRDFTPADDAEAEGVGLVNRALAESLWEPGEAVHKEIRLFGDGGPLFEVVGVVENVHQEALDVPPQPELYRPFTQWATDSLYMVVRSPLSPAALQRTIQQEIWSLDPQIPLSDFRPMDEVVRKSLASQRYTSTLLLSFAIMALVLGMAGVFGLLHQSTSRRIREFGVRKALGATSREILGRVLGQSLRLVGAGLALGFVGAIAAADKLEAWGIGVSLADIPIALGVAAIVLLTGLLAAALPAWRGARIEPTEALRQS